MNCIPKLKLTVLFSLLLIIITGCSSKKLIKSEYNPYIVKENLSQSDIGKTVTITGKNQNIWEGKVIIFNENSITVEDAGNYKQNIIYFDNIAKISIANDSSSFKNVLFTMAAISLLGLIIVQM